MKSGNGFEQCYNAQAAVEVESRLIVGERITQAPNDKQQLAPTLAAVAAPAGRVEEVLADSGFHSEEAVRRVEHNEDGTSTGTTVYAALERTGHHRSVADLEQQPDPTPPATDAGIAALMRHRLKTRAGKALDKLRQSRHRGIEPTFGIIKSAMGFRRFLLRGLHQVSAEWTLVCLAYNIRRLHRMGAMSRMAARA